MRYFRALIISLIVHVILAVIIMILPRTSIDRPKLSHPQYVDLLEKPQLPARPHQPPKDDKIFVRSAPAPAELQTKENQPKRFVSEDEQNVLEETRAEKSGLTVNRSASSTSAKSKQAQLEKKPNSQKPESRKAKEKPFDKIDLNPEPAMARVHREILEDGVNGIRVNQAKNDDQGSPDAKEGKTGKSGSRPLVVPGYAGLEHGVSTFGNDAPEDVKIGNFTALNTDRQLYYSFYSRIEEAIRHRWATYVRASLYEIETGQVKARIRDRSTTRLEVLLDKNGNFVKAMMTEGSGFQPFDVAPVQAFREAGRFPNPPSEMVKDDGLIHIYYAFTVDIVPKYASGGRGSGSGSDGSRDADND